MFQGQVQSWVRAHHVVGVLRPEAHQEPDSNDFESTPDERCGPTKAHVAPLPARHPCCMDEASVGAS
jgi:hypothetical protein